MKNMEDSKDEIESIKRTIDKIVVACSPVDPKSATIALLNVLVGVNQAVDSREFTSFMIQILNDVQAELIKNKNFGNALFIPKHRRLH